MSLDSKIIEQLKEFLIKNGYTQIDQGLIVFGGKNNGTVDLKATKDNENSIIIEIKSIPIHMIDLSQYLQLKRNIEAHNPNKKEKLRFFLLTCDDKISPAIIKIAKDLEISIENFTSFLNKKNV